MLIQETMLTARGFTPEMAQFPYLGTPKIDGIRFYVDSGDVWARSNKMIPNLCIRNDLPKFLPDGTDGELFVTDYSTSMSEVMTEMSVPTVGIYVFDLLTKDRKQKYIDRAKNMVKTVRSLGWTQSDPLPGNLPCYRPPNKLLGNYYLVPLIPVWIKNHVQFEAYYESCLGAGHEGICFRSPSGPYKFGRCTVAENYLLKYKPVEDREAVVLGVEELLVNQNESVSNELGRTKRSTVSSGLAPAGTFGSFHVRDLTTEVEFKVGAGPGLTAMVRQQLWDSRRHLYGKTIKYRCMPYGAKEKPRQPQFLGFRDERDLS